MEQSLQAALIEADVRPKEAAIMAKRLTDNLKALSRTPGRGGAGPSRPKSKTVRGPFDGDFANADRRSRRPTTAERAEARAALEAGCLMEMDERAVNAALGLPPPLMQEERIAEKVRRLVPRYKSQYEVIAYVVSRLAPDYAAARRVLEETARMLAAARPVGGGGGAGGVSGGAAAPGTPWRPREVLVHGAGAGAAVVAALEALPRQSVSSLVAVEPSQLRLTLGSRVEREWRRHHLQGQGQGQQQGKGEEDGLDELRQRLVTGLEAGRSRAQSEREAGDDDAWVRGGEAALKPASRRQRREEAAEMSRAGGSVGGGVGGAGRGGGGGPRVSWVQELQPLHKNPAAQRRRYDVVIAQNQIAALATTEERHNFVRQLWERCGDVLVLIEPGTPRGYDDIVEARKLVLALESHKRARAEAAATAAAAAAGPDGAVDPRVVEKLREAAGAHVVAPCPHDAACPMQGLARRWCHFEQGLLRPGFMRMVKKAFGGDKGREKQDERFSYVVLRRGPRPEFRVTVARSYASDGTEGGNGGELPPPPRLPPRVVLSQVAVNRAAAAAGDTARAPLSDTATVSGSGVDGPGAAKPGVTAGPVISAFAQKFPAYGPGLVGRLMEMQDAGVDWAASAASDGAEGADAAEADLGPGLDPIAAAAAAEAAGSAAGGSRGSLRSLGLDAAVAELSVDVAAVLAARRSDRPMGHTDAPANAPGVPAAAGPAAQAGLSETPVAQPTRSETGGSGCGPEARPHGTGSQPLPFEQLQHLAQARQEDEQQAGQQQQLEHKEEEEEEEEHQVPVDMGDVSEEEYEAAEAQLLRAIYGASPEGGSEAKRLAPGRGPQDRRSGAKKEDEEEGDDDDGPREGHIKNAGDAHIAEASVYSWGRIVRETRRRSGHVLLDMCIGTPPSGQGSGGGAAAAGESREELLAKLTQSGQGGGGGGAAGAATAAAKAGWKEDVVRAAVADKTQGGSRLVTQVVTKSSKRIWQGQPAYRLARRLAWGDCWPDWYVTGPGKGAGAKGAKQAAASGRDGDDSDSEGCVRDMDPGEDDEEEGADEFGLEGEAEEERGRHGGRGEREGRRERSRGG